MPLRAIRRLGNLFLGEIENNHLRAFAGKAQGDALADTRAPPSPWRFYRRVSSSMVKRRKLMLVDFLIE